MWRVAERAGYSVGCKLTASAAAHHQTIPASIPPLEGLAHGDSGQRLAMPLQQPQTG